MNDLGAEIIEAPGRVRVAGEIECVRDKRSVTRPEIAVMISRTFRDIRIVCRQDRTVIIDLGADDQQRAVIEFGDVVRQA